MKESPIIQKNWKKGINTLAIVYPNLYYGGVYCLAPLIFYNLVNQQKNWICERKFLDSSENLSQFNLIGFTFQYEPDYYNFIKILKENNISLNPKERKQIIFAGGPCINQNPLPLLKYLDFIVIGEIEEVLPKILDEYEKNKDNKSSFLSSISKFQGVYIPDISKTFSQAIIQDLDKIPYPLYQPFPEKITKNFVFGKVFMLEIERGCPFHCKFCPLSAIHKTIKFHPLEKIKQIIDQGIQLNKRDKVVIYSPSFTHPKRKEILKYILSKNLKFSVPSIKVELMDEETLTLIKQGKQKTLTIAPEANESMRFKIGKNVKDEKFFEFAALAKKLNFEKLKLYFLIGLPSQTQKDLDEMLIFIKKIKLIFPNTSVSVNPLVPKPKTEFSNLKFNKSEIKKQTIYLKKQLSKIKIKFKIPNISQSYLEYKLAFAKSL